MRQRLASLEITQSSKILFCEFVVCLQVMYNCESGKLILYFDFAKCSISNAGQNMIILLLQILPDFLVYLDQTLSELNNNMQKAELE